MWAWPAQMLDQRAASPGLFNRVGKHRKPGRVQLPASSPRWFQKPVFDFISVTVQRGAFWMTASPGRGRTRWCGSTYGVFGVNEATGFTNRVHHAGPLTSAKAGMSFSATATRAERGTP